MINALKGCVCVCVYNVEFKMLSDYSMQYHLTSFLTFNFLVIVARAKFMYPSYVQGGSCLMS